MPAFITHIPKLKTTPKRTKPKICLTQSNTTQRIQPFATPSKTSLTNFSTLVRGEWKGYEGRFTPDGKVVQIPDYYVPEEFFEWGLTPNGFECVNSVIVRENKLYRKFFRILPSVSLFADHVDTEEEFGYFQLDQPGVSLFDDGSWIRGLEQVKNRSSKLEKWPNLELYLRHPNGQRRAVTASLSFDLNGRIMDDTRVVLENWVCDYCDGADIDGGSGFVQGWVEGDTSVTLDRQLHAVFLPEGIDFGVRNEQQGLLVWLAWSVDDNRVCVSRRFDSDGNLLYSEHGFTPFFE